MEGETIRFNDLRRGMRARVAGCSGKDEDACLRLREMGLTNGAEFSVVKVAPLGDPIEIDLRGYRLCLRRREAEAFYLELVAPAR